MWRVATHTRTRKKSIKILNATAPHKHKNTHTHMLTQYRMRLAKRERTQSHNLSHRKLYIVQYMRAHLPRGECACDAMRGAEMGWFGCVAVCGGVSGWLLMNKTSTHTHPACSKRIVCLCVCVCVSITRSDRYVSRGPPRHELWINNSVIFSAPFCRGVVRCAATSVSAEGFQRHHAKPFDYVWCIIRAHNQVGATM